MIMMTLSTDIDMRMEEQTDDDLRKGNGNGKGGMNLYRTWLYPGLLHFLN